MSRRSETWNAYESKLAGPLPSLSTSVSIESTAGLDDPAYLVIDPDFPLLREWIRVGTITPGLFENIVRNQEGSVGNIDHETGAIVRAVFTKQLQDDIFEDIEDTEGAVLSHVNVVQQPDPHTQYLLELTASNLYVPLVGNPNNPMTGALHLRASDPTDDEEATKRSYVDASHAVPIADHALITDAHHSRYTDAEAIAAVDDGTYLKLSGGTMTGALVMGGHGIHQVGNPDSDDDAVPRGYGDGRWLRLSGDTMTGDLHMGAHEIKAVKDPTETSSAFSQNYGDGRYLQLTGGALTGALTQQPGGLTFGAAEGSVIHRWNGDGNTNTHRRYEWRRGSFGSLELFAVENNSVATRSIHVNSSGSLELADVTLLAGTDADTSLRFAGMGVNDGFYGNGTEMSFAFGGFRHFSIFEHASPPAGSSHVEIRGDGAVPLAIIRADPAPGPGAIVMRIKVSGQPDLALTYADFAAIT